MLHKLSVLCSSVYYDWRKTIELFVLFRHEFSVRLVLLATLRFLGKFFNMLVMFLPLKIFLVLSGTSEVGLLKEVEVKLGTGKYVILVLFITASLYVFNMLLQLYYARVVNVEKLKIKKSHQYLDRDIKVLRRIFSPCVEMFGSLMMLSISLIIFFLLSYQYLGLFSLGCLIYYAFVQYFLFTNNKFRFLDRANIDIRQAIEITSGVFFLFVFFLVFFVYIKYNISVVSALLLLLLSRLNNNAIKVILFSISKVRVLSIN